MIIRARKASPFGQRPTPPVGLAGRDYAMVLAQWALPDGPADTVAAIAKAIYKPYMPFPTASQMNEATEKAIRDIHGADVTIEWIDQEIANDVRKYIGDNPGALPCDVNKAIIKVSS